MKGVQNFDARDFSLKRLRMEIWGRLIFLNFGAAGEHPSTIMLPEHAAGQVCTGVLIFSCMLAGGDLEEQIGPAGKAAMEAAGMTDTSLVHIASQEYHLDCNWKVFVDNYLVRAGAGGKPLTCFAPPPP